MLGRGWRYRRATRPQTWIDPETGDTLPRHPRRTWDRPAGISNEARPLVNRSCSRVAQWLLLAAPTASVTGCVYRKFDSGRRSKRTA
jgi:hypothetical protein